MWQVRYAESAGAGREPQICNLASERELFALELSPDERGDPNGGILTKLAEPVVAMRLHVASA